ncbi:N-acetylgalactosamine-6-sulfatase [bacterium E08(2017)]|nr:N-acetylgalactosamine-6-sulfatase [bacterium E08(2017)]
MRTNTNALVIAMFCLMASLFAAEQKPNFILIFVDDLGYGDIGCFGNEIIRTPNIDRMAEEGLMLTDFYVQPTCGPSRTALMTGCYPLRVATKDNTVNHHPVVHTDEITIAELLKGQGYATGCFGKWGLAGHHPKKIYPELMPNKQGFDYYFGTPASNDSTIDLYRNDTLIEENADMDTVTERYTDEAIKFIKKNKNKPFFAYIPHTMPHTLLGASKKFRGRSPRGLYGDVVEELDYSVGRILKTVEKLRLTEKTYVIFTSDNGAWYIEKHPKLMHLKDEGGSHGGSNKPLRGHKTSCWEGGVRVPFVAWAPGRIPEGKSSDEVTRSFDLYTTFARLAGADVPADRVVDGKDITPILHGEKNAKSHDNTFYYYDRTCLMAVREGDWKLQMPVPEEFAMKFHKYFLDEDIYKYEQYALYNLRKDIGEKNNIAAENPDVVKRLRALAEKARDSIGDYNRIGKEARFFDSGVKRPDIKKEE